MPDLAKRLARIGWSQSLGGKLLLILTAVGLAGALAITVLLAAVITPSFNQLEAKAVGAHVDRTRAALGEFASKVESAVRDYGDWNSSYDYMAHPTRRFENESFSTLAMANLDIAGMAYVRADRHVVIARWLDADGGDDAALRGRFIARIARLDLDRIVGRASSAHYYTRLGDVVAAVGVARVRRSDGSGAPRGFVLMARPITSAKLSDLLQLDARLDLQPHGDREDVTPSRTRMSIAVPIVGPDGHAVADARFVVPRDVSVLGRRMLLLAIAGTVVLMLLVLMMLRRMITRLVLRPLGRVEDHMQRVSASGSLGLLETERRQDEIGSLGRSFNSMLRQLKDLREQLEVQSFDLGKSESAVAVMHNVRNALAPISTIISKGLAQPPAIDRATLDRAVAELARDDVTGARRQKLAAFVAAAVEAEAQARIDRRADLEAGREALGVVLEIIGHQQQAAHERPPLEPCDVTEIIAQNATLARYSSGVSIAFSFPGRPHVAWANRLILSQVIGNLFANAGEAIAATGRDSGSITATVDEDADGVTIAIRDDGQGFAPGVAASLFQRGFSTREHKSGGLGLHWCANSMTAMEGALRLDSEGPSRGAIATLTLRAWRETVEAAA